MDTYDLKRFISAQETNYNIALQEIRNGHKRGHWMWYIFPQIAGFGHSKISRFYAIKDIGEATAYLAYEILGSRLVEISKALLLLSSTNATDLMGSPDDLKLRSSMTLYAMAPGADPVFQNVMDKFFNGTKDEATIQIIMQNS